MVLDVLPIRFVAIHVYIPACMEFLTLKSVMELITFVKFSPCIIAGSGSGMGSISSLEATHVTFKMASGEEAIQLRVALLPSKGFLFKRGQIRGRVTVK